VRELLMVGRLPESWIPPEHLLELRARVWLRHTLVDSDASGSSPSTDSRPALGRPQV
jgi:hypothetical protein